MVFSCKQFEGAGTIDLLVAFAVVGLFVLLNAFVRWNCSSNEPFNSGPDNNLTGSREYDGSGGAHPSGSAHPSGNNSSPNGVGPIRVADMTTPQFIGREQYSSKPTSRRGIAERAKQQRANRDALAADALAAADKLAADALAAADKLAAADARATADALAALEYLRDVQAKAQQLQAQQKQLNRKSGKSKWRR